MTRRALHRAQLVIQTTGQVDVALALLANEDTDGGGCRLVAEYEMYLDLVGVEAVGTQLARLEQRPAEHLLARTGGFVSFEDFCALGPGGRAKLVLKHSTCWEEDLGRWIKELPDGGLLLNEPDIEEELTYWLGKLDEDDGVDADEAGQDEAGEFLARFAEDALKTSAEDSAVQGLLGLLDDSTYDPSIYERFAKVVQKSAPGLPPSQKLIASQTRMLQFVMDSIYRRTFKCSALDIWTSANEMVQSLPKEVEGGGAPEDAQRLMDLQRQAQQLESHLGCVSMLQTHAIRIPMTFWELRQCQDKPSFALSLITSIFRGFTRDYHPAVWWRNMQEPLLKFSSAAFPCLSLDVVYDFIARAIAQHKHWDVLRDIAEDWTKATAAGPAQNLYQLAREMIDACPSLKHEDLDDASKVLGYIPEGAHGELPRLVQAERNLVKACHKLYQALMGSWGANTSGGGSLVSIESVIGNPGQVRSMMKTPETFVKTLLHFNPNLCEEIVDLLSILGFTPACDDWAAVMEMVAAAKLLCEEDVLQNRQRAEEILDQLLANKHAGAWKIAVPLTPGRQSGQMFSVDHGSAVMADSLKVANMTDLPTLLDHFEGTYAGRSGKFELSAVIGLPPAPPLRDRQAKARQAEGPSDAAAADGGPNFKELFGEKEEFFPLLNTGARAFSAASSLFSTFRGSAQS